MATHTSSGSWSGAAGADVIDLDRFMRGVRPHRAAQRSDRSHLVVDNGGLSRKPPPSSSSSGASTPRVDTRGNKRFSHDSGVSDGSYVRRRHRPHRRYSVAESAGIKTKRETIAARPSGSSGSMRAFRTACERTLRDQQRQLARVALLCERLGERRERSETEPTERTKTDSSELSSSSRSTRDPRRKDKNRAQECKTYKIIMSKLDELNRMFVSRRSPPPSPARPAPRRAPSSGSVSVSDKLVATEGPAPARRTTKVISPTQKVVNTKRVETDARQLVERAVGESPVERGEHAERAERLERSELRSVRLANLRAINNAYALDIAPQEAMRKYPNIATESVVKRESSNEGSRTTLCDPRYGFDLDDPVQLYAQAKRLQALHVTSVRRARSTERSERYARLSARHPASKGAEGPSLCALCREYWRLVRGYLAAQVCCPRDDLPCACS